MPNVLDSTKNFLHIEEEFSSYERSRVAVMQIPYERTVSYGAGTGNGPEALLDASGQVEFFDEETRREIHRELGIATLEPMSLEGKSDSDALEAIYHAAKDLLKDEKFVVAIGGEHTISQALIAAHAELYRDISILHIDAHSDLRSEYQGNKFSHASVMARVCEFVDPRRLVQVGIRAHSIEEAEYIQQYGVTVLYAHEIHGGKYTKIFKYWDDLAIEKLSQEVYVSFDIDGLDPSIMPATGTPEPNGLFWQETMEFLRKLGERRTVVGCDLVEFAPIANLHYPNMTAARLLSKMINYFVR